MQPAPTAAPDRKRRIVTEEEREELYAADSLVELALIFDTSEGKKGAYGGLGQEARESTERTINDIIQATVPDVHVEQIRVDSINVFSNPSYYIVLLVSKDDAVKTLGPQPEVHTVIDYHIYGADAQATRTKRSDVAIIITTPDHIPNIALFANRPDKSTPAGGLNPGIPIVMYIQDTREIRIQTAKARGWLMDDALDHVNTVLATTLQPSAGYTIKTIPGQPVRLAPRTPGGVGIGISLKFWLIPPPDRDQRDVASIKGVLLPSPLLIPRRYVEDPMSREWVGEWMHDPDPTVSTRQLTRAERCSGGHNSQGDGVHVRYIVSGGNIGGVLLESVTDGEKLYRLGDDYDPESNGIPGMQICKTSHKISDTARRNAQRKQAAQRAQRAAAEKIDQDALRAHMAALAKNFLTTGVCRKAAERLSTTDSPCYIHASDAEEAATALDTPSEYLSAACINSSCRTTMCISFNKTAEAVVNSLSESRARAASTIATARMENQIQSTLNSFNPNRAAAEQNRAAVEQSRQLYGHHAQTNYVPPRQPENSAGKGVGKGKGAGKGAGKGDGKGAGKGDGKGAGKGNGKARALPPAFAADRLHATDGSGVFGHIPTAASGERRYDSNGAGPFTREQFHQYYNGSLREWDVATPEHFGVYAAPPRAPPTTRLTHPPSRPTPSTQADSTAEPNAKSPRMHTRPPHSPGHSLANTAANSALQEHGSHFPDSPMAQAASNIPIIHGWNYPMPPPGTVPIGKRITLSHLPAAAMLARGLYQLLSISPARTPEGRVLVDHQLIAEYLASAQGGSFNSDTAEGLMLSLEESDVVVVTTREPGGQHETQYFYDFIVAPHANAV